MEVNRLVRLLGRALIAWSIASIIVGVILLLVPVSLLQGIGLQAFLWGLIDILIAVVGIFRQKEQSAGKAARFLRINVFLDVGYQLVGLVLIVFLWQNAFLLGNGVGIIIQGAFLFVVDLYFYRKFKVIAAPDFVVPEAAVE
ncbi:MAG: DUF6992 family protein [Candidatus Thorarchaeota archaeon]